MAGETMKEGMTILEPHIKSGDIKTAGKIVIGTVRGDLHDIGKNIVVTLLKAANFKVTDLGIDVSSEQFVKAVQKHKPDIVAMSALLSTTLPMQRETIEALKENNLRNKVKVIVGGSPVTEEWVKEIGADGYADNASEAVRLVKKLLDINEQ